MNRLNKTEKTIGGWGNTKELMGHNKRCDICIIDFPLIKEKEYATKVMFKGIMAENFPGLAKKM